MLASLPEGVARSEALAQDGDAGCNSAESALQRRFFDTAGWADSVPKHLQTIQLTLSKVASSFIRPTRSSNFTEVPFSQLPLPGFSSQQCRKPESSTNKAKLPSLTANTQSSRITIVVNDLPIIHCILQPLRLRSLPDAMLLAKFSFGLHLSNESRCVTV